MKIVVLLLLPATASVLRAQPVPVIELAALVAEAEARNPEIQAAYRMAEASAARVPQAGALPDPVLSAGVMNLPARSFRLRGDEMAMVTIEVTQMIPAPGSLGARGALARAAHGVAEQNAREASLDVVGRLKAAYFEVWFIERALEILVRNRAVLEDFSEITRSRLAVGGAIQQDALRAQTEVTRLDEQIAALQAGLVAARAEVNAIVDRPAAQLFSAVLPAGVRALAERAPPRGAFTVAALDGGFGGTFPTLAELQTAAQRQRPALLAQARSAEQARAALRLAERERFPDLDVMLGFGTQGGGMHRVSAALAVPLPIFSARKQRQAVVEAAAELGASELDGRALHNEIAAEITAAYAALVRGREQILLLSDGILPQASATMESAAAAYQTGRVEFLGLLDAQALLFRNEIELIRQLADFARTLAELERAVGRDLVTESGS